MSIPEPSPNAQPPAGWYPTGETDPNGQPLERWWDGGQWSSVLRPLGLAAGAPVRRSRTRALIAAGVIVVLAGGGIGAYFALSSNNSAGTPSAAAQPGATGAPGNGGLGNGGQGNGGLGNGGQGNGGQGNGGLGNGGQGNGGTGGLGGGGTGGGATPAPTITGGAGKTVSDPIDGLTIPVPSSWTGVDGSLTGEGVWPALSTGQYTCPTALAQANGGSSTAQCNRAGINFATTTGSTAQSVATSDIAALAKNNYGNLSSHSVVNQGAVTVAGRAGYQVTWSVVPNYDGPHGTVELIAVPVPGHSGAFTLIDIGVDQSSQAPSLSSVNTQIIANITDTGASGV